MIEMNEEFVSSLLSIEASSELSNDERLYDRLIGSWNARVIDYDADGSQTETAGEWHFSYTLDGRAVQDVFIVPARPERTPEIPKIRNRYGTSVRSFHPTLRKWTITWINPVTGAHNILIAQKDGGDIIQNGRDADGSWMRWGFTDIKNDSARWYGERSRDEGETWQLEAEFFLTRIP